ncbi:FHA domain-containing protein [Spirosoma sp.]|uniref:FHA domain-containing protein n=1 Tax=Spirosoma sp. TaxID=1899569 RepID=UPI0026369CE3|nr:FHA domain-containing protein [Spirosoma sp.]MCX6215074.1 FHA domain-containing protein [Spirosoma sp.]
MSLLDSVKNLFGFTPAQAVKSEPASEPASEIPKPVSKGLPPAGQQRDRLLRFIIDKLRPYQNEPETAPSALDLCILCSNAEEEDVYNVALWASQQGKFRSELARQLADNYIQLPANWRLAYTFYSDALPDCTYREGNLGLLIPDKTRPNTSPLLARLVAVKGQMEQDAYSLDPTRKNSYCIGRGHSTQTASGHVRTNDIVILNDHDPGYDAERGAGNGAVSRAHATLRYDAARRQYSLLADPGGLPASGNKTKIFHPDGSLDRADILGMGYPLQHGDQIELGGEVTLLFEIH